jgi:3-oxoacyl-[acyl-carrier protein] reductase
MGDLLKDKIVLVTGSGQGIGRAIAMAFAAEGAKVVTNNRKRGSTRVLSSEAYRALSAERKKEYDGIMEKISGDAETTAQAIRDNGGEAIAVFADISRADEVGRMVRTVVETYGTVHILVNVAGAFGGGALTGITERQWDLFNDIKPKGYFLTMKAALPYMVSQHWGRIINTTSRVMMGDIIKMADYCTANAGVVGLTQGAACEYFHEGITVNAFNPHDDSIPGFRTYSHAAIAPAPEAVPPFLLFLCSENGAVITGSIFTLAGKEISLHQYPAVTRTIKKYSEEYWTVDELRKEAPRSLFKDYQNILEVQ